MIPFSQQIALSKGNDKPMDQDTILRVTLPIKVSIDAIKRANATDREVFECMEFFALTFGALSSATERTAGEGKALLLKRCDTIAKASSVVQGILKRLRDGGQQTCNGAEIAALDEGFTAAMEAHEVLPEWAFMQAGYQLMRYGLRGKPKPKRRHKR